MKIIELLNKIANGEEVPKKIKYSNIIYKAIYRPNGDLFQYVDITNDEEYFNYYCVPLRLNDEVEILEEEKKIPEKLEDKARFQYSQIPYWFKDKELIKTINENFEKHQKAIYEIIDYLKSKGDE